MNIFKRIKAYILIMILIVPAGICNLMFMLCQIGGKVIKATVTKLGTWARQ